MILFLHPSQDIYSINCSSLRHKAKLHFINSHYSTKPLFQRPFPHLHSSLIELHSSMAVPDITLPLEDRTHYAYSADIPIPSRTLTYFNHHFSPLSAINSSDTSDEPGAFLFSFHLMPVAPPLCLHSLWTFYCISFHIMFPIIFFIHDPFHIILPDFTSLFFTEAQLSTTPSHTPSSFIFLTISFQSFY